jgi:hypothetical protein
MIQVAENMRQLCFVLWLVIALHDFEQERIDGRRVQLFQPVKNVPSSESAGTSRSYGKPPHTLVVARGA